MAPCHWIGIDHAKQPTMLIKVLERGARPLCYAPGVYLTVAVNVTFASEQRTWSRERCTACVCCLDDSSQIAQNNQYSCSRTFFLQTDTSGVPGIKTYLAAPSGEHLSTDRFPMCAHTYPVLAVLFSTLLLQSQRRGILKEQITAVVDYEPWARHEKCCLQLQVVQLHKQ